MRYLILLNSSKIMCYYIIDIIKFKLGTIIKIIDLKTFYKNSVLLV